MAVLEDSIRQGGEAASHTPPGALETKGNTELKCVPAFGWEHGKQGLQVPCQQEVLLLPNLLVEVQPEQKTTRDVDPKAILAKSFSICYKCF